LYSLISTPGYLHSERFSEAATVAGEFGEIDGAIRHTRHRAGFWAKPIEIGMRFFSCSS
jgi:hypothetical protein